MILQKIVFQLKHGNFKYMKDLVFRAKKIYPSETSEILYKGNEIFVLLMKNYMWYIYISMYEAKSFSGAIYAMENEEFCFYQVYKTHSQWYLYSNNLNHYLQAGQILGRHQEHEN